jgi:hypothetical protein
MENENITIEDLISGRVKEAADERLNEVLSETRAASDGQKRTLTVKITLSCTNPEKVESIVEVKKKFPDEKPDAFPRKLDFSGQEELFDRGA